MKSTIHFCMGSCHTFEDAPDGTLVPSSMSKGNLMRGECSVSAGEFMCWSADVVKAIDYYVSSMMGTKFKNSSFDE